MPRPSQRIDVALLTAGRELFAQVGCAGLSVRRVAEHAGVNPAMFHYHFGSKDEFLRLLLQQLYDEMFASLAGEAEHGDGGAAEQLRRALTAMARFARRHGDLLARVWMDAIAREPVAVAFFTRNAPRHLGVLQGLLQRLPADAPLRGLPPQQGLLMLLGAVLLPMIFVAGLVRARALPALPAAAFDVQVMSDEAIDQRIELVLRALLSSPPSRSKVHRAPRRAGARP